jgi:hypothetical protein
MKTPWTVQSMTAAGLSSNLTGLVAIADRDYDRAAVYLGRANEKSPQDEFTQLYRMFALCMAGRIEESRKLALHIRNTTTPDEVSFWQWIALKFGI